MKRDYKKAFQALAAEAAAEGVLITSVQFQYSGVRLLDSEWVFGEPDATISATVVSAGVE